MTPRDFCYWLQGYFELNEELQDGRELGAGQTEKIKRRLALVFEPGLKFPPQIPSAQEKTDET